MMCALPVDDTARQLALAIAARLRPGELVCYKSYWECDVTNATKIAELSLNANQSFVQFHHWAVRVRLVDVQFSLAMLIVR